MGSFTSNVSAIREAIGRRVVVVTGDESSGRSPVDQDVPVGEKKFEVEVVVKKKRRQGVSRETEVCYRPDVEVVS